MYIFLGIAVLLLAGYEIYMYVIARSEATKQSHKRERTHK